MYNTNNNNSEYGPGGIVHIPTRSWPPPVSPPCYMPQDNKIPIKKVELDEHSKIIMFHSVIGYFVKKFIILGKNIDWSQLPDMTGTRPGVDKYSITKYSIGEWQQHNARVLEGSPIVNADR